MRVRLLNAVAPTYARCAPLRFATEIYRRTGLPLLGGGAIVALRSKGRLRLLLADGALRVPDGIDFLGLVPRKSTLVGETPPFRCAHFSSRPPAKKEPRG